MSRHQLHVVTRDDLAPVEMIASLPVLRPYKLKLTGPILLVPVDYVRARLHLYHAVAAQALGSVESATWLKMKILQRLLPIWPKFKKLLPMQEP
jgi:hypothetical protein